MYRPHGSITGVLANVTSAAAPPRLEQPVTRSRRTRPVIPPPGRVTETGQAAVAHGRRWSGTSLLATRREVRTWESLSVAALEFGDHDDADRYVEFAMGHPWAAYSATLRGLAWRARIRATRAGAVEPSELTALAAAAAADFASSDHWTDVAITEQLVG